MRCIIILTMDSKEWIMLKELKKLVFNANMKLVKAGLVIKTWGNVSGIDRRKGLVVIKPSGMPYEKMRSEDMVVVDLDGNVVEGNLKPSSDTPTHLVLYNSFKHIGGIVHTHSTYATGWAQAGRDILCYGTTHADYFYGSIPCTSEMTKEKIINSYEVRTGEHIVQTFVTGNIDPERMPAILVNQHGPFVWGKSPVQAADMAMVLEEVAKMAYINEMLGNQKPIGKDLLEKHFHRKHGKDAYYGQH